MTPTLGEQVAEILTPVTPDEKITGLEKRIEQLENVIAGLFDDHRAFVGGGVAVGSEGVGCRGVNIYAGEGSYHPGIDDVKILAADGRELTVLGGVIVDTSVRFHRR